MKRFRARLRVAVCGVALVMIGCGSDESEVPEDALSPCEKGQVRIDPTTCTAAGVPPDGCAPGFASDERAGCEPILPAGACAPGQLALPGESECHDPSPCGRAPWGDAPIDATSQFVDASYAGGDGDGTEAKPWTSVQDAINAAAPGSVIAVAAGTYAPFEVRFKPVRVWGRCARMVEIDATPETYAAINVREGAPGTEIHSMATQGGKTGVTIEGSVDVIVEGVWLHDAVVRGLSLQDLAGPTRATLRDALIEASGQVAAFTKGCELAIERAVIRGPGVGIAAEDGLGGNPAKLSLSASIVEKATSLGITVGGSTATLDGALVRDIAVDPTNGYGRAVQVTNSLITGQSAELTMRRSVVARTVEVGVFILGSNATFEDSVVRDGAPRPADGRHGEAIALVSEAVGPRARSTIRRCLVERSTLLGIVAAASDLSLEQTLVREVAVAATGGYGDAVACTGGSVCELAGSLLATNPRAGFAVFGSAAALRDTVFECNAIDLQGEEENGPFAIENRGGNVCGCSGDRRECKVLSSGLSAPDLPAP